MSEQQQCLFVLGMHRSGTSAMTGLLNMLGLPLGKTLVPALSQNPKGFFENQKIMLLNNALFAKLNSSWDDLFLLPDHWWQADELNDFKLEFKKLLQDDFGQDQHFMIKDPRLCILLPFWHDILHDLGIQSHHLIMLRNPTEIAKSLSARNQFSTEKSLLLWMHAMLSAEFYTRNQSRFFVSFDDLIADPYNIVERVTKAFPLPWPSTPQENEAKLKQFIDQDLKHHNLKKPTPDTVPHFFISDLYTHLKKFNNTSGNNSNVFIDLDQLREQHLSCSALFLNNDLQRSKNAEKELKRLNPTPYAKLYFDTGKDFNEEQSLKQNLSRTETRLEFDLSNHHSITRLRFDPMNEPVVIKIIGIDIITQDGILHQNIEFRSNATHQQENLHVFTEAMSYLLMDIEANLCPKTFIIRLEYTGRSQQAYQIQATQLLHQIQSKNLVIEEKHSEIKTKNSELLQKDEIIQAKNTETQHHQQIIQSIENSWSWKITKPFRFLKSVLKRLKRRLKPNNTN